MIDVLSGTWSVSTDNEVEKLVLDFGENVPFNELSDDWDIVGVKETRVELKNEHGDESTDKLVLERL